jgi:hypothetical protein
MICETRQRLLDALAEISRLYPPMRLGQLIENLTTFACEPKVGATWDVEDDELLQAAQSLIRSLRQREQELSGSAHTGG